MKKQEFKDLTGENPEDVFGADWENDIEELEILKQGEMKLEEKREL